MMRFMTFIPRDNPLKAIPLQAWTCP